jgi:hypothetical protein
MSEILNFLDKKQIFFLLFLAGFVLSLCFSYSYCKVGNTEDVKTLHKLVYYVAIDDSTLNIAKQIEKRQKGYTENLKARYRDDYYKKLDVKTADADVKRIVIFMWLITAILFLLAFALRKRTFLSDLFKYEKSSKSVFWYQRHPKLFMQEEAEIRKRFANAEKTVENGVVSFTVPTYKRVGNQQETLCFQLAYSPDYANNREIKIYLITPDLTDLYGGSAKQNSNIVNIDGAGECYLDFSKLIPKERISGMEVIRKLYKWLQSIENK